jgi:hypothetical protein
MGNSQVEKTNYIKDIQSNGTVEVEETNDIVKTIIRFKKYVAYNEYSINTVYAVRNKNNQVFWKADVTKIDIQSTRDGDITHRHDDCVVGFEKVEKICNSNIQCIEEMMKYKACGYENVN